MMRFSFRPPGILFAFSTLALVIFLTLVVSHEAYAAAATATNSCTDMQTWGFTTGLVYCIQTSLDAAVTKYVTAMQGALRYYEGMMAAVAIMLFGFKAMNSNIQEPVRETSLLIVRLMIGIFVYENAVNIYHWIAGTLPNDNGIMNEAIGWVTGTGSSASGGTFFSTLVAGNCKPDTPPVLFEGYQIWGAFDCMFSKILGAADPTAHPYAFATSLLVVIAAAIFSATMGVLAATLGITLFVGALMFVFRAIYLVLMAFVCVGFMTLFAPLLAPMIFFESEFLNQKFKQWAGVIISCIFQPVLVIGFLAMGIAIGDQIIEGNFASPGCTLPSYPSGNTNAGEPAVGWGHDGSGVCSFTQLFNQGAASGDSLSLETIFQNMMDSNAVLVHQAAAADPIAQQVTNPADFTPSSVQNYNNGNGGTGYSNDIPAASQIAENSASIDFRGATRLKNYVPVKQLTLTLITFIFTIYAMYQLLDVIPEMAQRLTISVGVNLASKLQVPLKNEFDGAMKQAEKRGLTFAKGKGLVPQLFNRATGASSSTSAATSAQGAARSVPGVSSAGTTVKRPTI